MGNSTTEITLGISGMHCAGCVSKVESALARVPGVNEVYVNPVTARALISTVQGSDIDRLIQAVRSTGYDAKIYQGESIHPDAAHLSLKQGYRQLIWPLISAKLSTIQRLCFKPF
ncbi:MAG: cation transporter [Planctomycetota bacterium]